MPIFARIPSNHMAAVLPWSTFGPLGLQRLNCAAQIRLACWVVFNCSFIRALGLGLPVPSPSVDPSRLSVGPTHPERLLLVQPFQCPSHPCWPPWRQPDRHPASLYIE